MASSKLCLLLLAVVLVANLEAKPTNEVSSAAENPQVVSAPDDDDEDLDLPDEDDDDDDDGDDEDDDDDSPVRILPFPKELLEKLGVNGSLVPANGEVKIAIPNVLTRAFPRKKDLIDLLIAKSKTNVVKNLRDKSLSKFIKSLIKDCIKDIIRTINTETKPVPVVKEDAEKAQEKVNKLKDEFNKNIEDVYAVLFKCLRNGNSPSVREKIQDLIDDAKLKVESLVEFYTGTSKTFIVQLKSEKEIINNNIRNFTDAILFSKCLSVRQSKTAFQKCVEPIYCEFTANLTNSIDKVEELSKVINLLTEEAVDYVQKAIEKLIKEAKERVKTDCENDNTTNPETNTEYLKNASENALKEVENILKGANNNKNDLNNTINLIKSNPVDVNATQVGLRETIQQHLNNTVPPNDVVNKYVEEKQKIIDDLTKKVIDEINNRQKEIQNVENQINTLKQQYTAEKVNDTCKGNEQFTSCVDSAYRELTDKLKPLVEQLNNINKEPVQTLLDNLKNKTDQILKEATEEANRKSQIIIDETNEKIKYVVVTKENSDAKIKSEVDPLVNETSTIVTGISSNYDNVVGGLRDTLVSTVKQNADDPSAPLSPEDQQLVNELINEVNRKVDEYKNQLQVEEAKVKELEQGLKNNASKTDQQYLRSQCSNDWDFVQPYKSCIDQNIAPLNNQTDNVVRDVKEIIENLKQRNISTDLELKNLITDVINRANQTTIVNRNARDENNETTSTQRIMECLESINEIVSKQLTPFIESLYLIPQELQNASNPQVKAANTAITAAFQSWVEALDLSSALNPKQAANNTRQKGTIKGLIEQAMANINSNIRLNLDSFIPFELRLQAIQESLYKNISQFNLETLNKTCASVYSSRTNYSKCIDAECSKFKVYIDETSKALEEISEEGSFIYVQAANNITATIHEEEQKALEKAKKEAEKLFEENKITKDNVLEKLMEEFKRFNVTPYNLILNDIRNKAIETNRRSVQMNSTGNNMLNRVTLTLNLHVYAASQMCPRVSIKNETDYARNLIEEARSRVHPVFPNATSYANQQIALADSLQGNLNAQVNALSPANVQKSCGGKQDDLFEYYTCIRSLLQTFENYFVPANAQGKVLGTEALYGIQNKTLLLNKWRDEDVTNELNNLKLSIGPIPEAIYSGPCNATKDKAVDFALVTVNDRWNRYNKSLPVAEKATVAAANQVLSRNYTGLVPIEDKLNDSVKFIRDAIVAANKVNASYVTPAIRGEPDRNIGIGIGRFNNFINEIYSNATKAIKDSKAAREQSEALYKNISRPAIEEACWKADNAEPISSFVVCNNQYSYGFEVELQKLQTKMEDAKKLLDQVNDTAGKKVLEDYANKLAKDLKEYSAQYAIVIYQNNKLPIPDDLKPYVKTNCLVSGPGGCLIEF